MAERMHITKLVRTEPVRADLYAKGHQWPDLKLFELSDLLEVGIDPGGLEIGEEVPCRFWAHYALSDKRNRAGNPYKDVLALEPVDSSASAGDARFAAPVGGTIIRDFRKGQNEGIDIAADAGTAVMGIGRASGDERANASASAADKETTGRTPRAASAGSFSARKASTLSILIRSCTAVSRWRTVTVWSFSVSPSMVIRITPSGALTSRVRRLPRWRPKASKASLSGPCS